MGQVINSTMIAKHKNVITKDILQSVSIDIHSCLLFFVYFVVIYLLATFTRVKLRDHRMSAGYYQKLVRIVLNQPNFNPKTFSVRMIFINFILAMFFLTTIYRNMFKTDLQTIQPIAVIDTFEDFLASGRIVIFGSGNIAFPIVNQQNDRISKELRHKINKSISFAEHIKDSGIITEALGVNAISFFVEYMHNYYELWHCGMGEHWQLPSPYYVSKQRFFKRLYGAIYQKNISSELRERLDYM